ncbi:MAG: hypothetical protein IIB25_12930 [Chloroflexi bacterium]|nr:hypothetical protein [Chloroflexota bacterium]
MTLAVLPASVEKFAPAFESLDDSNFPAWLIAARRLAWANFSDLGIPIKRRGNELWKYTNLRPLAEADFEHGKRGLVSLDEIKSNGPWDDAWDTVVVVDDHFSSQLSSLHGTSGLTAGSLAEAIAGGTDDIESQFASLAGRESYAFTALNTAFAGDGVYLGVSDDVQLEVPVHVVFVSSNGSASRATYPRLLVSAGENSSFTIIETYINLAGPAQLTVPVVEIFAARTPAFVTTGSRWRTRNRSTSARRGWTRRAVRRSVRRVLLLVR